ncbi:MAG: LysM peptidoglycan-binding domain-containing protein [Candidatus Omnitrophica bacterium]|nr:LysM peptidoglycan-binding domain-containing protein [Candidatus Omnitrophota bacterium]
MKRKVQKFLIMLSSVFIFAGCTTIASREDLDAFKTEIDRRLEIMNDASLKKSKEIDESISNLKQMYQQQQETLMSLAEENRGRIQELKIAIDDSMQSHRREFEFFKKNQEEKNVQFAQDIDTIKSQNELMRTSASLMDSMVNLQKDILALKTSLQQVASEFDAMTNRKFVDEAEILKLKKYYDGQIEALLNEIVRQESDIFMLKQIYQQKQPLQEFGGSSFQPKEKSSERYHTVKKGETLNIIAKKYGTTTQKLREINKLNGDTITIGQKLVIP